MYYLGILHVLVQKELIILRIKSLKDKFSKEISSDKTKSNQCHRTI